MSHLDDMLEAARERVADLPDLQAQEPCDGATLLNALRGRDRFTVLARYERVVPGSGSSASEAPLLPMIRLMADSGCAAISISTEYLLHRGRLLDLELALEKTALPIVMSDVVIDPVHVRVAAALGAHGVELLARVVSPARLAELGALCREYGCAPLIQCWREEDVHHALAIPEAALHLTDLDLATLERDPARISALLDLIPEDRLVIASGDLGDAPSIGNLRGRVDAISVGPDCFRPGAPRELIEEITR